MLPALLDLEVPDRAEELFKFTKSTLSAILLSRQLDVTLQQKIKLVLTELVTNAIKHAKSAPSRISVLIDQSTLVIKKLEPGSHLRFSSGAHLPFTEMNKVLQIGFSFENKHSIQTLGDYKFKFLNRTDTDSDIAHFSEHFGLYIITKASDSFIYEFHPDYEENEYIVVFNL